MKVTHGFDALASSYDEVFTNTDVGRLQRKQVWKYLNKAISQYPIKNVLELGCGTGEDAAFLVDKGLQVKAFDASSQMVALAREKIRQKPRGDKLFAAQEQDLAGWIQTDDGDSYDLIFSNFGVLNLMPPQLLSLLNHRCSLALEPGGHLIVVLMSPLCLWESLYYLFKGNPRKIFRRWSSQSLQTHIAEEVLEVWYHTPRGFAKSFTSFKQAGLKPIGLAIPPSYLAAKFDGKSALLKILESIDYSMQFFPFTAPFADHFLLHLIKKS